MGAASEAIADFIQKYSTSTNGVLLSHCCREWGVIRHALRKDRPHRVELMHTICPGSLNAAAPLLCYDMERR